MELWPSVNMGVGYGHLVNEAISNALGQDTSLLSPFVKSKQLKMVLNEFNARIENDPRRPGRTTFEEVLQLPGIRLDGRAQRALRLASIQAYHLNFAMCMTGKQYPSVGIVSYYSTLFGDYTQILEGHRELYNPKEIPVPARPKELGRRRFHDGGALVGILEDPKLQRAKRAYLVAQQDIIVGSGSTEEARTRAAEYSELLADHFKIGLRNKAMVPLLTTVGALAGWLGTVMAGSEMPASNTKLIGHGTTALGVLLASAGAWHGQLVRLFTHPEKQFFRSDRQRPERITRLEGPRIFSQLDICKQKATEHLSMLPSWP